MDNILEFDWYKGARKFSHVIANYTTGVVEVEDFPTGSEFDWQHTFFGNVSPSIPEMELFFQDRVFPQGRTSEKEMLDVLGLAKYDVLAILRKTRGKMDSDNYWIHFKGDDITWDDIKKGTRYE